MSACSEMLNLRADYGGVYYTILAFLCLFINSQSNAKQMTESKSVVTWDRELTEMYAREPSGATEMCLHQTLHLRWVDLVACRVCIYKDWEEEGHLYLKI